jgi:hypothetical protein
MRPSSGQITLLVRIIGVDQARKRRSVSWTHCDTVRGSPVGTARVMGVDIVKACHLSIHSRETDAVKSCLYRGIR